MPSPSICWIYLNLVIEASANMGCTNSFVYIPVKDGHVMGRSATGRWAAATHCPLSKSNSFLPIFTKLAEDIYSHNISVTFDNHQNASKQFGVMALELGKSSQINLSAIKVKQFPSSSPFLNKYQKILLSTLWRAYFVTFLRSCSCKASLCMINNVDTGPNQVWKY